MTRSLIGRAMVALVDWSLRVFFALGGGRWYEKKYGKRYGSSGERKGVLAEGAKGLLWIYARTAGEVQSALPFIHCVRADSSLPCAVSFDDTAGLEMARSVLGLQVERIFYTPWAAPQYAERILDNLSLYK